MEVPFSLKRFYKSTMNRVRVAPKPEMEEIPCIPPHFFFLDKIKSGLFILQTIIKFLLYARHVLSSGDSLGKEGRQVLPSWNFFLLSFSKDEF